MARKAKKRAREAKKQKVVQVGLSHFGIESVSSQRNIDEMIEREKRAKPRKTKRKRRKIDPEVRRQKLLVKAAKQREIAEQERQKSKRAVSGIEPGQPILVGHHSEGKQRRAQERSYKAMGRSVAATKKAEQYEAQAAAVGTAPRKGDAERARQAVRDKFMSKHSIGQKVFTGSLISGRGEAEIVKFNKKSVRLRLPDGTTYSEQIHLIAGEQEIARRLEEFRLQKKKQEHDPYFVKPLPTLNSFFYNRKRTLNRETEKDMRNQIKQLKQRWEDLSGKQRGSDSKVFKIVKERNEITDQIKDLDQQLKTA